MKKSDLLMIRSQICEILEDEIKNVNLYVQFNKTDLERYYNHDMTDRDFENFSLEETKENIKFHEAKIKILEDLIVQVYRYPLGE